MTTINRIKKAKLLWSGEFRRWCRRDVLASFMLLFPASLLMSGCTTARNEMRLTFDPNKLVPGASRRDVESELGRPDQESTSNDMSTAVYSTSRVAPIAKKELVAMTEYADILTIGLFEFVGLFGADETKAFTILYTQNDTVSRISYRCLHGTHNGENDVKTVNDFRSCHGM